MPRKVIEKYIAECRGPLNWTCSEKTTEKVTVFLVFRKKVTSVTFTYSYHKKTKKNM